MTTNIGPINVKMRLELSEFAQGLKRAYRAAQDFSKRLNKSTDIRLKKIDSRPFLDSLKSANTQANKLISGLQTKLSSKAFKLPAVFGSGKKGFASQVRTAANAVEKLNRELQGFKSIRLPEIKTSAFIGSITRAVRAVTVLKSRLENVLGTSPQSIGKLVDAFNKIGIGTERTGANLRRYTTVTKTASKATKDLERSTLAARLGLASFAQGTRSSVQNLSRLARTLTSVRILFTSLVAGFGLKQFTKFAADLSNTEQAFTNLARSVGVDAVTALERLRRATRNTVSDFDLFRQTNNAILLGVGESIEDFELLAAAGRRLGKATGRTAAEGFQDLATGIGRQSRLILDNLGIIVKVEQAYRDYADSVGKTVTALSQSEQRVAFQRAAFAAIRENLDRVGDDTFSFGDAINRAASSFQNLFQRITRALTPAVAELSNALSDFVDRTSPATLIIVEFLDNAIRDLANFIKNNGRDINEFFRRITAAIAGTVEVLRLFSQTVGRIIREATLGNFEAALQPIKDFAIGLAKVLTGVLIEAFRALAPVILQVVGEIYTVIGEQLEKTGVLSIFGKLASAVGEGFKQIARDIEGFDDILNDAAQGLFAEGQNEILGALTGGTREDIEKQIKLLDTLTLNYDQLINRFNTVKRNFLGLFEPVTTSQERAVELFDDLERATAKFDSIESLFGAGETELKAIENLIKNVKAAITEGRAGIDFQGQTLQEITSYLSKTEDTVSDFLGTLESTIEAFNSDVGSRSGIGGAVRGIAEGILEAQGFTVNNIEVLKQLTELEQRYIAFIKRRNTELDISTAIERRRAKQLTDVLPELERDLQDRLSGVDDQLKLSEAKLKATELNQEFDETVAKINATGEALKRQIIDKLDATSRAERFGLNKIVDNIVEKLTQTAKNETLTESLEQARKLASQIRADVADIFESLDRERSFVGLDTFERALKDLERDELRLIAEIDPNLPPEERAALEREIRSTIESARGIVGEIQSKEEAIEFRRRLAEAGEDFSRSVGSSLFNAIRSGEDPLLALGQAFEQQLERAFQQLFDGITDGLQQAFQNINAGTLKIVGALTQAAIGLAGLFLTRQRQRGSSFTENPTEGLDVQSSAVRGVIAGPSDVAISEVGSSLREAMRGTESLLTEIRDILASQQLGLGGIGSAGTV